MSINSNLSVANVLEAIQKVAGSSSKDDPIVFHEPDFRGTEAWTYVKDCLDTGWVSTAGQWVTRFEQLLCTITGAGHAVAVSNGTVALRLALHLVGVRRGDEVFLPPSALWQRPMLSPISAQCRTLSMWSHRH